MTEIRSSNLEDLGALTLYSILRLRVDVFVVEQQCIYPELDGEDLAATHYWVDGADGQIDAYLRVIDDGDRRRIGRVVTAPAARGRQLAGRLLDHVLEDTQGPWFLSAQTYLRGWYAGYGFTETSDEYVEDGIPHVDMSRLADERTASD